MIAVTSRATILLLFATMLTGPANAQGIIVEGRLDCGEWAAARIRGKSIPYEHYLIGLLNGLALGHQVEFWHAAPSPISREAVYLWMDGYCQQNPLGQFVTGAVALYLRTAVTN